MLLYNLITSHHLCNIRYRKVFIASFSTSRMALNPRKFVGIFFHSPFKWKTHYLTGRCPILLHGRVVPVLNKPSASRNFITDSLKLKIRYRKRIREMVWWAHSFHSHPLHFTPSPRVVSIKEYQILIKEKKLSSA